MKLFITLNATLRLIVWIGSINFFLSICREQQSSPFMSIWSAVNPAVPLSTQLLARVAQALRFLILTAHALLLTHREQQTRNSSFYTKKDTHTPPTYEHKINPNECWGENIHPLSMCIFAPDLTCGILSGRLCFNQKRDGLILNSINRSQSITVPAQVKRWYIILAGSAIQVLIRSDRLKRSCWWGWASSGSKMILLTTSILWNGHASLIKLLWDVINL